MLLTGTATACPTSSPAATTSVTSEETTIPEEVLRKKLSGRVRMWA